MGGRRLQTRHFSAHKASFSTVGAIIGDLLVFDLNTLHVAVTFGVLAPQKGAFSHGESVCQQNGVPRKGVWRDKQ